MPEIHKDNVMGGRLVCWHCEHMLVDMPIPDCSQETLRAAVTAARLVGAVVAVRHPDDETEKLRVWCPSHVGKFLEDVSEPERIRRHRVLSPELSGK